jgi:hypothetical protein
LIDPGVAEYHPFMSKTEILDELPKLTKTVRLARVKTFLPGVFESNNIASLEIGRDALQNRKSKIRRLARPK